MTEKKEIHEYTLQEIAEKTNTPNRTVRYYISKGLLPPPLRAGRDAAYTDTHIKLLEEIRIHKAQGYTLNEINRILSIGKIDKTLPEPTLWQSYKVSDYVEVNVLSDIPPWHLKSILKNIKRMTQELQTVEE